MPLPGTGVSFTCLVPPDIFYLFISYYALGISLFHAFSLWADVLPLDRPEVSEWRGCEETWEGNGSPPTFSAGSIAQTKHSRRELDERERDCHAMPDLLSVCARHSSLTAASRSCSWAMSSDRTACSWGKLHPGSLSHVL